MQFCAKEKGIFVFMHHPKLSHYNVDGRGTDVFLLLTKPFQCVGIFVKRKKAKLKLNPLRA